MASFRHLKANANKNRVDLLQMENYLDADRSCHQSYYQSCLAGCQREKAGANRLTVWRRFNAFIAA